MKQVTQIKLQRSRLQEKCFLFRTKIVSTASDQEHEGKKVLARPTGFVQDYEKAQMLPDHEARRKEKERKEIYDRFDSHQPKEPL